MTPKPTFVVLPGAFHLDECLSPLVQRLDTAGYPTRTATLKSVDNPKGTIKDDAAHIRDSILLPLLEEGKDVVFVIHSYAGFPGSVAVKGLAKGDRVASGLKGGIIGIVYMCAFVPIEGRSLRNTIGNSWPPWQTPDDAAGLVLVPEPISVFYHDVEEELAKSSAAQVKPHSMQAKTDASPSPGYLESGYDGRRAYIKALHDRAMPFPAQEAFIEESGVKWNVKTMDTGHSPFLAKPQELSDLLEEFAESFSKVA